MPPCRCGLRNCWKEGTNPPLRAEGGVGADLFIARKEKGQIRFPSLIGRHSNERLIGLRSKIQSILPNPFTISSRLISFISSTQHLSQFIPLDWSYLRYWWINSVKSIASHFQSIHHSVYRIHINFIFIFNTYISTFINWITHTSV